MNARLTAWRRPQVDVARSLFCALAGWASAMPALAGPQDPELVLQQGVRLIASTPSGTVGVIAGEGLARTYEWNGCALAADMMARSTRWHGAKGIYDPAGRGPLGMLVGKLVGCQGVSRTVVEEAQAHFSTAAAAERWVRRQAALPFDTVWSRDGLLVQWGVSPQRGQINVSVWQVCVAGDRPTQLRGASDDAIRVERVDGEGEATRGCAAVDVDATMDAPRGRTIRSPD